MSEIHCSRRKSSAPRFFGVILPFALTVTFMGCSKPYPAKGSLSAEVAEAIHRSDGTFIQRQLDSRLINPEDEDGQGETALMLAASNGQLRIVQVLIKGNADPNHADHNGETAVDYAAQEGDLAVVKALVEAKADVNAIYAPGVDDLSTLWFASDHPAIYKYLVAHGARPVPKNSDDSHSMSPTQSISWERARPLFGACDKPRTPNQVPKSCSYIGYNVDQKYFFARNWKVEVPEDPDRVPAEELIANLANRLGPEYGACFYHGVPQDCSRFVKSTSSNAASESSVRGDEDNEWQLSDNGRDVSKAQAGVYCESLGVEPYGIAWTLGTRHELADLYDPSANRSGSYHIKNNIQITGTVWAFDQDVEPGNPTAFDFTTGQVVSLPVQTTDHMRALCVRRLTE